MVYIKGTVVLDTISAVRSRDGDAVYDRIVGLLDEDSQRVFRGQVIATGWYPLDAFVRFLAIDLRETAGGDEAVLVARSEAVVERQLRGVYRVFARMTSAESMIRRLMNIHKTYFQGTSISYDQVGRGRATVRYTGLEPHHRLMEHVLVGFYRKALQIGGAKRVSVLCNRTAAGGAWELDVRWE